MTLSSKRDFVVSFCLDVATMLARPFLRGPNMDNLAPAPEAMHERIVEWWCHGCETWRDWVVVKWQPTGRETAACTGCGHEIDL